MGRRDIERRLKAAMQTGEITEAMRLVASSRLEAAALRYSRNQPYAEAAERMAAAFAGQAAGHATGWPSGLQVPPLLLVFGAEQGLAGSYHADLAEVARQTAAKSGTEAIWVVGARTAGYLQPRGLDAQRIWPATGDNSKTMVDDMVQLILDGRRETVAVFTRFFHPGHLEVQVRSILPIQGYHESGAQVLVEPSSDRLGPIILRTWIEASVGECRLSALAAEHAARMVAMTSASENAREMMDELTLERHRLRQAGITEELVELLGGSS